MGLIIVYITNSSEKEAKELAQQLLEKKLIACANIFPITSMYRWENKIEHSIEYVAIVKTRQELWEKLKQKVEEIHPYETPCIIKINTESNDSYENWIKDSTT